jgi:hypothetical protein
VGNNIANALKEYNKIIEEYLKNQCETFVKNFKKLMLCFEKQKQSKQKPIVKTIQVQLLSRTVA